MFSAATLNYLQSIAKDVVQNKASDKIIEAIGNSFGKEDLRKNLGKIVKDAFPGSSDTTGSAHNLQEFFDSNVDNIWEFIQMFQDQTRIGIADFLDKVFKYVRTNTERQVLSLVEKGYKVALTKSSDLRGLARTNTDRERSIIRDLYHDIKEGNIIVGKRNYKFILKQRALIGKIEKTNSAIAGFGATKIEKLLLRNLKSTDQKFSEFDLGFNLFKSQMFTFHKFLWSSRLEYLAKEAEKVKDNL